MENQTKILTRVQLINWHYFENERIAMNGSTLISGENTAGKSTILDAIQLVLTTNTRKFNVAANEKGNRDLKGYVRCKIGNVGEAYIRKNTVPANVALEFYEEKASRYFVIGVHMLSVDEESPIATKWYCEECRLEDLSFMAGERPSLADEFRNHDRKIRYIEQKNAAKDRFKRRLGNLDDKFFDIIPKSLAFKPMDNVKDFINKFVLSEAKVDVASLRENIETLSELESLLERSQRQLGSLELILEKRDAIESKEKDIRVNELLIAIAECEALNQELESREKQNRIKTMTMDSNLESLKQYESYLRDLNAQIIEISIAIKSNESNQMVEQIKRRIDELEQKQQDQGNCVEILKRQVEHLRVYMKALQGISYSVLTPENLSQLLSPAQQGEKVSILNRLIQFQQKELNQIRREDAQNNLFMNQMNEEIESLQQRQKSLEKQKLTYPENDHKLKQLIQKEFEKRQIHTSIYYLSELLEVSDPRWINAVEGYLNTQKFYLVVEPEYYDVALEVYDRYKNQIHSAGILNTRKLPLEQVCCNESLAYVVSSENRYAKAYTNYILGRVIRCENVKELEEYEIAITAECMLYQGYVVRHLNPKNYNNPFIGQNAYRTQLLNVKKELEVKSTERTKLREKVKAYTQVLEAADKVKPDLISIYMDAPFNVEELTSAITIARRDLKEAESDPTLIELTMKLEAKQREQDKKEEDKNKLVRENARLEEQIDQGNHEIQSMNHELEEKRILLEIRQDEDGLSYKEAVTKYQQNRKTKKPRVIVDNFTPQKTQYTNEKDNLLNGKDGLIPMQYKYNQEFSEDFLVGLEGMADYREACQRLKAVEMVRYEEKLKAAKENCEEIFRSDFLSKMKEHIEAARNEFRNLNKALDSIYYGDDSYHFKISFDKKKEGLYRMITSESNQEGYSLWTSAFEAEYHEEMAELFEKLMTKDDKGEKIVEEYTDYRSYLDYDIEIHKRDGSIQRFSDIYGEKSGSETQVPYYVAIAASFFQLYRYGNSVRLMLLDEAFDKMDDERIESMMEFFNGLNLQVIMATPPAKIEVIGEKVQTVLTAIRVGKNSIIEEYDF